VSPRPLVVIGAGGFGREVLDVVEAINSVQAEPAWEILGVADDAPAPANLERLAARSVRHLGTIRDALASAPHNAGAVIAVGSPTTRRAIAEVVDQHDTVEHPVLVHPRAYIGSQSSLGLGTVVCAGAQVSTNVRTGRHTHINPNATIGHDAVLGDFVSVNPGAIISGECAIEGEVLLGAGAVVLQQLHVGARATVGAAACVVRDVQSDTVVKGVPAH
jgi:sugar O-acyltransferase (sialic acid O-acetyltransferase NeuD family)